MAAGHLTASLTLPLFLRPRHTTSKELMMEDGSALNSNTITSASGDKKQDQVLLQPFTYVLQVPGKMIRAKLAQAFNYWMKIPEDKLLAISDIIHMLHNASLLIDDIEDNSVLRRGIPVAHSIYGVASTINSANYVYFLGLERVLALDHPEATRVFCEQLLELHRGQGMEIYWRDSFTCPTEAEYRQMTIRMFLPHPFLGRLQGCYWHRELSWSYELVPVAMVPTRNTILNLTGGLFGLAIRLMQLFSTSTQDYSIITGILGLYFQIRDDYANLCMKEYSDSKSYCEDLTEGKFSFPVIHAITTQPDDQQVINIIRQRPKDLEVKRYCVSLLEKFGSLRHTQDTLQKLEAEARQEIASLGGNPHLEALLDELRTSA